jgi:hypothetical protein
MSLNSLSSMIRDMLGSRSSYPLVDVKSTVDGKTYRVRDLPDKQDAANLMARVRRKIGTLCDHLESKYKDKIQIQQLIRNFKAEPSRFIESTPDSDHTSYTVNKGEAMHLCLRQRDGGPEKLVNDNVMTFVAVHELAHTITRTIDHGPDFWNNFGWILREAESIGVYQHQDFAAQPVSYCGVRITDSPKYDPAKDEGLNPDAAQRQSGTVFQFGKLIETGK